MTRAARWRWRAPGRLRTSCCSPWRQTPCCLSESAGAFSCDARADNLSLAEKSFDAPGAERVGDDYQNLVKYFKPTDSDDAERLASAVASFFPAKGCPVKLGALTGPRT